MRAIITRGLYIFYPIFEVHFIQKILSLCMVSIQDQFLILGQVMMAHIR